MPDDGGERSPVPLRIPHPSRNPANRGGGKREVGPPPSPSMPVLPALSSEYLDPEKKLNATLEMVARAYEEWQEAVRIADEFGAGWLPPSEQFDADAKREEARLNVRKAYQRYYEYTGQATRAEQEVRRRKLEAPLVGPWRDEFNRLRGTLTEQYSGLGPHYDLLCDNAAATAVRLRQLEESGRDFDSGEYVELHKLHISYVNQLQKYTEAMKSESINKQTQEVAERIIQIFERHFGTTYPEEWKVCVTEVVAAVQYGEAA